MALSAPQTPGSGAGSGGARADEISGVLRAEPSSTSGDSLNASAILRDEVRFSVAGNAPITGYLNTWFEGTAGIEQGGLAQGAIELLSINRVTNVYSYGKGYLFDGIPCGSLPGCSEGSAIGRQVTMPFTLLPGERLDAFALRGRSNFANSAYVWLDVPDGVTWTPTSAGFLSLATPVPEPTSLALLGLGLLVSVVAARWRVRIGSNTQRVG